MVMDKKIYTKDQLLDAQKEFDENGIVFFDNLLSDEAFNDANQYINKLIASNPTTNELTNLHFNDEWIANFISREEFTNIASKLLGVDSVNVFSSLIINKPAKGLMTVPWHQDGAYDWPLNPIDCASLWLAFDDVTCDNGAMKVAVGAHKRGILEMIDSDKLEEGDSFFSEQLFKTIPEKSLRDFQIIDVTMKKGQASFHHNMLPHCSTPNSSNSRRCAFVIRYCRGDAKLIKYPGMKREADFKNYELFEIKKNK